ncbi:MAG: rod shape-determining protein MreC [Thermodesulfobacteriota bacterium]
MMRQRSRVKAFKAYFLYGIVITVLLIIIVSTVGRHRFNAPQKFGLDIIGRGQYVVTRVSGGIKAVWQNYLNLVNTQQENKVLREQLAGSTISNQGYREAMAENTRLRKLLKLKDNLKPPTISAQIIGRDPSIWFRTLTIDQGSSAGIEKGMPVLTVEGVVGQILETSPATSKVLLAIDPNSAVDVLIQKNRAQGILKGTGKQQYELHYILKNVDVEKGDLIVTSGLGGSFPKGVPLGSVSSVVKKRRGMFQEIEIAPTVDFNQLEYLIIILRQDSLFN